MVKCRFNDDHDWQYTGDDSDHAYICDVCETPGDECEICDGEGILNDDRDHECDYCDGEGVVEATGGES